MRLWYQGSRVRKIWVIFAVIFVVLFVAPMISSYLASIMNHNSINDYPQFYWYFPFLAWYVGAVFVIAVVYTAVDVVRRIRGRSKEEDD